MVPNEHKWIAYKLWCDRSTRLMDGNYIRLAHRPLFDPSNPVFIEPLSFEYVRSFEFFACDDDRTRYRITTIECRHQDGSTQLIEQLVDPY